MSRVFFLQALALVVWFHCTVQGKTIVVTGMYMRYARIDDSSMQGLFVWQRQKLSTFHQQELKMIEYYCIYVNRAHYVFNSNRSPSAEWTSKMWYICQVECYLAIRKNAVLLHATTWMYCKNVCKVKETRHKKPHSV